MQSLSQFEAMYKNYKSFFRKELIWDIYSTSNEVTLYNLITYELCLGETISQEWKKLFKRDYPIIGIYDYKTKDLIPEDYRKKYLLNLDVLKNT